MSGPLDQCCGCVQPTPWPTRWVFSHDGRSADCPKCKVLAKLDALVEEHIRGDPDHDEWPVP